MLRKSPLRFVLAGSALLAVLLLVGVVWAFRSGWVAVEFPILSRPANAPRASAPEYVAPPTPTAGSSAVSANSQNQNGETAPWVVQPMPPPGSRVSAGPLTIEAYGHGQGPLTEVRLQLDDASLPVTLDRRSELIWIGRAATAVKPGHHELQAVVIQADGKSGSYRWSFEASAP